MQDNILLSVRDLKIEGLHQGMWQEIVKGVSFELTKGEVIGLIGESGAGKSTIGLATLGYSRPGCRIAGGRIILSGKDVTAMKPIEKRKLRGETASYVAQSAAASFNPAHRLIRQFSEVLLLRNLMTQEQARQRAIKLYKRLLLPEPEKIGFRYPHQVSGGQLQRAMIAMAMGPFPQLIVFDEPTTALDVTTQLEVLLSIKETIKSYDTAIIYITHDLAVVSQIADRIMVLRYGETVEEGETRQLLANPKMEYTRKLLGVREGWTSEVGAAKEIAPILEIEDLSGGYEKGRPIIKDIDVKVEKGRTLAVVGESGSGKSTLARAIVGLLPHLKGAMSFEGVPLSSALKKRSKDLVRRIQMVYQMPNVALNPRQKIRTIIGRPLELFFNQPARKREERVKELLGMVELPDHYIDRLPRELSGGEKQRVCIARALAAEPTLIICDEVTSALDQLVGKQILELLRNLQKQTGMTYIYITHDLDTVRFIADYVAVMRNGLIVEMGAKKDIFSPPHHEYTELLLSSVPQMDPDWLDRVITERELVK